MSTHAARTLYKLSFSLSLLVAFGQSALLAQQVTGTTSER